MGEEHSLLQEPKKHNFVKNDIKLERREEASFNSEEIISLANDFKDLENFFSKYITLAYLKDYPEYNFYDGNISSDLMVIGDRPSNIDLKAGKPFQGEVGKLLDAMLKAIKFDRNNTYFSNLNYIDSIKNEYNDLFLAFIHKQIQLVSPKIIIMFGAEVTKTMTGENNGIFASRGKWFNLKSRFINTSFLAISMFHPRQLIVKPENKKESWIDLKEIRQKYTF